MIFHSRPMAVFAWDAPLPWPRFAELVPIARTPLPARTSLLPGRKAVTQRGASDAAPRAGARSRQTASHRPRGPSVTPLPRAGSPRRVGASAASSLGVDLLVAAWVGERRKPQSH